MRNPLRFTFQVIFCAALLIVAGSYKSLTPKEVTYSGLDAKGVPFDRKLVKKMNFRNGIFIEVGANNGITQSNTKLFEERYGWTGILVEPSPNLFETLCKNRPNSKCFQCALGSFKQNKTYIWGDFDGDLMSSVDGDRMNRPAEQKVLVRSLQSILDEVGLKHINFFSLDVEGYELNILKGINFKKTTFDYILIEVYKKDMKEILAFLGNKGYTMVENFSNYTLKTHPGWDGTHNDYLFKRVENN